MDTVEPKRIGIDARSYNWTGIGRYIRNIMQGVLATDHTNEYVVFLDHAAREHFVAPSGARVKVVEVECPHYSLKEQTTFLRTLQREKLDLVHFPHFNLPLLYRRPFVVTIHDLTLSFYPGKKMTSPIERLAYQVTIGNACRSAKGIIAVSENTKKDIIRLHRTAAEKISVIYEAVETQHYHQFDENAKVAVKSKYHITKPFLLYVGVWRNHKNVVGMLEGFKKTLDRGVDAQLVITGKADPHYPEVLAYITEHNLSDAVILPGFVDEADLPTLFAAASGFVFPSFYEGFGLPPLEAMAAGTPVISSNMATMQEILGDAALYFDPQNTDAIATAMEQILQDHNLRETLRQKGLVQVQKFSWQDAAKKTHDLYRHILGQ